MKLYPNLPAYQLIADRNIASKAWGYFGRNQAPERKFSASKCSLVHIFPEPKLIPCETIAIRAGR